MPAPTYAGLQLAVAPAAEILSTADAKEFLRIDTAAEDELIAAFILTARLWVEKYLGKALVTQEWKATYESFHVSENDTVQLPMGSLQSVESVKYYDSDDVLQTVSTSDYYVDTLKARVRFTTLPDLQDRPNALEINYTAGYGDAATDVPEPIITAVRYLVTQFFENRIPVVVGTSTAPMPMTAEYLLLPYTEVLR